MCPANPYRLDVLQANGIETARKIQFGAQWISNNTDLSPNDFYESTLFSVEDLIHQLRVDLEVPYDGQSAVIVAAENFTNFCGQNFFRPTEYYFNGRCYSFLLPDCVLYNGVLEMVFSFKEKGKLTNILCKPPLPPKLTTDRIPYFIRLIYTILSF